MDRVLRLAHASPRRKWVIGGDRNRAQALLDLLEPDQEVQPALSALLSGRRSKAENELSTDECLELIDEMKALGTEMLILTGGEPLLRKDIFDIAQYASTLQHRWS